VTTTSVEGLTRAEAGRRLAEHGPNTLPEPRSPSTPRRLFRGLRDPLVVVLLVALLLTLLTGDLTDAAVIAVVLVVNSTIGLRQELQADRAVRALSQMVAARTWVVRDGETSEVPVVDVVPGDVVRLHQGDLVPADAVLLDASGLEVDESMLTGESLPVGKVAGGDPSDGPPSAGAPAGATEPLTGPDRVMAGTVVLRGRGLARVVATGADSSVGRIAAMMATASTSTPLQRRMARLSAQLAVAAVLLSLVVLVVGLRNGQSFEYMAVTTIALIVAAVPESLPLVVTVSLALAARRMAQRHAVVRSLAAVETLGSVTLLATDKTGTLTQGTMQVSRLWQPAGMVQEQLLRGLVLCNDAAVDRQSGTTHADPTEGALLSAAVCEGVDVDAERLAYPRLAETPFDSTHKMMTTVHRTPSGGTSTWHKGAPEVLLRPGFLGDPQDVVDSAREQVGTWSQAGMRVIAVAFEPADDVDLGRLGGKDPVPGPRLLGLVALHDPVRTTSRDTVAACRDAGIRVILVTGDHPGTAQAIADLVGIDDGVVARATPADKHSLVAAYQQAGEVVAMTGDGVNDAPALRRADIGVAMGRRGTEVARQAAGLVLTDDDLGTVVAAVEEGRRVYDNIRRFLVYGLSGGAAEVLLMVTGPLFGFALPLLPAQILWLNLLTHSFAGAGLAAMPANRHAMRRGPRPPTQGPLAGGLGWRAGVIAIALTALSVGALLASPAGQARTAALLALGTGQLAVAWALRTSRAGRRWSWGRPLLPLLLLAAAMLAASTLVPGLREVLATQPVGWAVWAYAGCSGLGAYLLTRVLRARDV